MSDSYARVSAFGLVTKQCINGILTCVFITIRISLNDGFIK